ncbi:MAG: ATP-binding protein, partial [Thermodesulfovibrionales bacterium]|nr:ATP-binding protein [Thermodesulfovibrionales bacterium]
YKCHHKISRILAPIIIKNKTLGFIIIGKFFYKDENIDLEYYGNLARICNFDKAKYFSAINKIPIYDEQPIKKISSLYQKLTNTISELCHKNIENRRLLEEKEQLIETLSNSRQKQLELYREIKGLLEISRSISERFNYKYTSDVIFAVCKEIIGNDMAFFSLLDDDLKRHTVVNIDTGSQTCTIKGVIIDIHGLWESAYKSRSVVVDNDFKNSPHYKYLPDGHPQIENLLISPMFVGSMPIGMLALANKQGGFNDKDITLASNIADIASYAIFNIKNYEDALISEAKYKRLVDSAQDAIFTLNSSGQIVLWNKGAEKIFGYSENEALLQDIEIIIPERFRNIFREHFNTTIKNKGLKNDGFKAEVIGLTKDQREIPIDLSMNTIKIKDELYFTYIQRDITERKAIEQELKIAKENAEIANQSKSEFLSTVTHELRTPLNVMLGFIDLIRDTNLDEQQKYYFNSIQLSSKLLLSLINDILDISKMEKGKLELNYSTFDVYNFFDNIFQMFKVMAIQKGLTLTYKIESNLPKFVFGDEGRLRQIMINLLGNALKFTDVGFVHFEVMADDSYRTDEKIRLIISVKDSGVGIPTDKIDHIFEDFVQLNKSSRVQGTGLGLPICKRLVKMMNGDIWVDSIFGKGSTFYFTVELGIGNEQLFDKKDDLLENFNLDLSKLANKKILLVEDNTFNQFVLKQLLANKGINVTIANNGDEAIHILSKNNFDVVLMDIQMPLMNGLEATKIIRDPTSEVINHEIPIIAFTAHALTHEKETYLNIGMNDYIIKPVEINLLLNKIQRLIS